MQHRTFMIPPDMVREVRSLEGTQARATLVKMQDALITITQTAWEQRRMQTLTSRREGRGRGRQRDTVDTTVGKKRKKTVKNALRQGSGSDTGLYRYTRYDPVRYSGYSGMHRSDPIQISGGGGSGVSGGSRYCPAASCTGLRRRQVSI